MTTTFIPDLETALYSYRMDDYLANCQYRAYQRELQRQWDALQAVPAYTERYATVAAGLASFARAMGKYIMEIGYCACGCLLIGDDPCTCPD